MVITITVERIALDRIGQTGKQIGKLEDNKDEDTRRNGPRG
jgi:hypothetical protein